MNIDIHKIYGVFSRKFRTKRMKFLIVARGFSHARFNILDIGHLRAKMKMQHAYAI